MACDIQHRNGQREKRKIGRYIGESGRTLAERSLEHVKAAQSLESDNFIIKHWALEHSDLEEAPRMRFKLLKSFNDPMSRLISESVWIDKFSNMNSKSEWRNNKMSRLVVEAPGWIAKKESKKERDSDADVEKKIEALLANRRAVNTKHEEGKVKAIRKGKTES